MHVALLNSEVLLELSDGRTLTVTLEQVLAVGRPNASREK